MKKLILLAITTIFSFNLYSQIYWEKHPDNPVLTPGSPGEWDEDGVSSGSVIYYDNTYHMWYTGGVYDDTSRIGHATSPDGVTWTKDPNNPVLDVGPEGAWDDVCILGGNVLVIDSIFHIWYGGHTGIIYNQNYSIGHATSPDGVTWTKDPNNPVLEKGPAGDWDDVWVGAGPVVYDGSKYHMYFIAWGGIDDHLQIGHATSLDAFTWTKDTISPVVTNEEGSWDYPRLESMTVIFDGDTYQMWYSGGLSTSLKIGYATSEDGRQWEKYGPPVLRQGSAGSWDVKAVYWPTVLFDSSEYKYKMWYGGAGTDDIGFIGYTESDARLPALWVKNKTLVDNTDILVAEINKDGIIHLVPYGTSPVIDSINKYSLASTDVLANTEVNVPLTYLPVGQYMVVAVSNMEFVCPNPFLLMAVPDASIPELTIAEDTVRGAIITATNSKDGILYLLKSPVTPDLSLVRNPNFLIDSLVATSDVPVEFPTSGLIKNISYWLYAVDIYGQFSERGTVRVEQGVGVKENANAGIRIYPNPTNDLLTIETGNVGQHSVEINSLNGQLIYQTIMDGSIRQIDFTPFRKGVYLITVRSKDFVTTRKIIKH